MSTSFWRTHWQLAALFNLVNALIFLIDYKFYYSLLGGRELAPEDPSWLYFGGLTITLFGIAYYAVSTNLTAHKDIVVLGIAGKVGVWAIFTIPYLLGIDRVSTPDALVLLIQGDLLFGLFFIWFLFDSKNLAVASPPTADGSLQLARKV